MVMAIPPPYVRVSVFQARTAPDAADLKAGGSADSSDAVCQGLSKLLRSKSEDYRGDFLVPLSALTSSSETHKATAANSSSRKSGNSGVRAAHLIAAIEQRLSKYCVLHIPASRVKAFVEENHISEASLTPFSTQNHFNSAISSADANRSEENGFSEQQNASRFCSDCSSSLPRFTALTEAPSLLEERAPWIHITQMQLMPGRLKSTTCSAPTAEEWMLRQQGATDVFISGDDANALHVELVNEDVAVEGGSCYVAFFQLRMVSLVERQRRLKDLQAFASMLSEQACPPSQLFLTVHGSRKSVRIAVPPPPLSSHHNANGAQGESVIMPDLKYVVMNRLHAQRGVTVRRLLDARTGVAILPCESAVAVLTASITTLTAECDAPRDGTSVGRTQYVQHPCFHSSSTTQELSRLTPTQRVPRDDAAQKTNITSTSADLFDHLNDLRTQQRSDNYYYDGFEGTTHDWAEQTAISLSELPSESDLQMTSAAGVASETSHATAIYPPSLSSLSRRPSVTSRTTASLCTGSDESSRSFPLAWLPSSGDETSNNICVMHMVEREVDELSSEKGSEEMVMLGNVVAALTPQNSDNLSYTQSEASRESVSPFLANDDNAFFGVRDSLRDMNEVFLYEDEETVREPLQEISEGGEVHAQHMLGSTQQRRSSLVWSTPAARGSGTGPNVAENGVSATPLTYRTSTQLSTRPMESPLLASVEGGDVDKPAGRRQQPIQRLRFSLSQPSLTPPSVENSCKVGEEENSAHRNSKEAASQDEADSASDEESAGSIVEGEKDTESSEDALSLVEDDGHEIKDDEANEVSSPSAPSTSPRVATAYPEGSSAAFSASNFNNLDGHEVLPLSKMGKDEGAATNTPPQRCADISVSSASTQHFACTPPSHTIPPCAITAAAAMELSSSSPQRHQPSSVRIDHIHTPLHRYFNDELDERTTPLPSCSTPPSRSRTSDHDLRSHLESLNPLPTQCNQAMRQENERVHPTVHHIFLTPPVAGQTIPPPASRRMVKRQREADDDDFTPSPLSRIARTPVGYTHSDFPATSAPASALRTSSVLSSLPSTVVAKNTALHHSPMHVFPEEVAGTADNAFGHAADSTNSGSACTFSSTPRSGWEPYADDEEEKGATGRDTPLNRGCRPFAAPYPLCEDDYSGSVEGMAPWDSAYSASHPCASPQKQHSRLQQDRSCTPQRQLVSDDFGSVNAGPFPSFPSMISASRQLSDHWRQQQQQRKVSDDAFVAGAPRVTSQLLRRSESHSASGMETWVRFSDVEGEETNNFFVVGDGGFAAAKEDDDDDEVMLVTQQEIPDYNVQLASSASEDEEADEGDEKSKIDDVLESE